MLWQPNSAGLHMPPCLVQTHSDEDVVAAVEALAAAIASGGSQLRRLQIDIRGSAFFRRKVVRPFRPDPVTVPGIAWPFLGAGGDPLNRQQERVF